MGKIRNAKFKCLLGRTFVPLHFSSIEHKRWMAPKKKKEFVAKNITTDMKMAANDLAVVNSCICKQIIVGQAKILLCPTIFICL